VSTRLWKIDALIEEKVFNHHVEWHGAPAWVARGGESLPGTPFILEDGREAHSIPGYSRDIRDAWRVVYAMRPVAHTFACHVDDLIGFDPDCERSTARVWEKVTPEVICVAALRSLGVEVSE